MDLEQAKAEIEKLNAKLNDTTEQLTKLAENNKALVDEKRAEADKRREAEKKAKEEAENKARETGDSASIIKSLEEKNADLAARLEKSQGKIQEYSQKEQKQMITKTAGEIAADIAYDKHSEKLLTKLLAERLIFEEDGVKVTNEQGKLTVSTTDELKKEFMETPTYQALIKGTQASGGRPTQPSGSPTQNKTNNDDTKIPAVEKLRRAHNKDA